MPKKPKPRNIPRTELDCIKARAEGRQEGYTRLLHIVTFILINDFGFNDFQLGKFSKRITYTCESIVEGRISLKDIAECMKDENDLEIVFN